MNRTRRLRGLRRRDTTGTARDYPAEKDYALRKPRNMQMFHVKLLVSKLAAEERDPSHRGRRSPAHSSPQELSRAASVRCSGVAMTNLLALGGGGRRPYLCRRDSLEKSPVSETMTSE